MLQALINITRFPGLRFQSKKFSNRKLFELLRPNVLAIKPAKYPSSTRKTRHLMSRKATPPTQPLNLDFLSKKKKSRESPGMGASE